MRFIHVADIHASRERLPQTLSILKTLTERCKKGDIDFILFAGDFWDSTITATKGSGFSDIISAVRELEKHTYLYFIYGTPTHEPNGSLDAFKSDKIFIYSKNCYKTESFLLNKSLWKTGVPEINMVNFIFIPEPRRSNYITKSIKETDEAINKEIKDFIKSTKDKDLPRIVVYHGEVKGAVYQNGSSASSATAIPKELLESLNADYYALGHIHLPQEVFPNAWYSGSACPKNFGEIHDGHYNLVTVENGKTTVEEVSFGLPRYETFDFKGSKYSDLERKLHFHKDCSNTNIRILFDCTREERKELNIKQLQDDIIKRTNALSVKIEPSVIEGNLIEKSEIIKHKSIVEKMNEYAKEKGVELPKYSKELLQDIQDNTLVKLSYPQHSFELLSLSLRGSIGIRDGQHKDDFELNFEKYEDGVVCLIGNCGKGKSSLLENCHPYPRMLTREGILRDHFYLRDSHRILVYKDETGLYYKISMLIDGKNTNGKVSYFVETSKDRESWKEIPNIDGSLEAYKTWVDQTFGSVDVFLRTAFFAKEQVKNTPDIADTTKSERMELLSKLAGTDYLKEVANIAKELRKGIEKNADKLELEISSYSKYEDNIKESENNIKGWSENVKSQEEVVASAEKVVNELKVKDAEFQKVKAIADANASLYNQYSKELEEKKIKLSDFEECVNNKEVYENITMCSAELTKNAPRIDELNSLLKAKRNSVNDLNKAILKLKESETEYLRELDKLTFDASSLLNQVCEITDICPTCNQPISEHKKDELKKHNATCKRESSKLINKRTLLDKECTELVSTPIRENYQKINDFEKEIAEYEKELKTLEDKRDENTAYIQKFNQLYIEWTYDEVVAEEKRIRAEVESLESKMEELVDNQTVEDVSVELSQREFELKQEQKYLAELNASIKTAELFIEKCRKELESVKDKKAELKDLKDKVIAYNFIEEAFSNNGIPAIELRESAPEIADIANKILADSYGNKFEIRFGPTSELKAKRKTNEDFNIIVYDTENGDEKTIDLVSSGERIWIKQALFYAFSIVQMNRTGFNFRTRLIDESDGSLDGGLRPKYLKMVTAAHHIADARVTILITHSQEIKDIAQQIIEI